MIPIEDISGQAFHTTTSVDAGAVQVVLRGNADIAALPGLEKYLKKLHQEIGRLRYPLVTVDIRELYFMNSSCLKTLVTWITTVGDAGKAERYRIKFVSNANLHWQRRSLGALKNLGNDTVEVVAA